MDSIEQRWVCIKWRLRKWNSVGQRAGHEASARIGSRLVAAATAHTVLSGERIGERISERISAKFALQSLHCKQVNEWLAIQEGVRDFRRR